ncbi:GFA family protein [Herbaspirillum frisingense]|uniref:GFA family protein n=1 Tax=Herbaspirillum frisingense TaxID=92645 RepID=UPI001F2922A5|nr:GFA family protein [Herbaspirillum frisingense]
MPDSDAILPHGAPPGLRMHHASCHCGAVRFRFLSHIEEVVQCNCSYCLRKAALHHRVDAQRFTLVEGAAMLTRYRFGTLRATHFFCRLCGTPTHCHPRSAPAQINVNVRCVDDACLWLAVLPVRHHDGRAWSLDVP